MSCSAAVDLIATFKVVYKVKVCLRKYRSMSDAIASIMRACKTLSTGGGKKNSEQRFNTWPKQLFPRGGRERWVLSEKKCCSKSVAPLIGKPKVGEPLRACQD